jgi:hypothetical protein
MKWDDCRIQLNVILLPEKQPSIVATSPDDFAPKYIYIYYKFGSYCALLDPKQQNRKRHRKKLFHLGTLRAFATPAGHEHLADLRPKESPQLCCEKLSAKVATVATPCWMKLCKPKFD